MAKSHFCCFSRVHDVGLGHLNQPIRSGVHEWWSEQSICTLCRSQTSQRATFRLRLIKRIFHFTERVLISFAAELEPQHLHEAGAVCQIRSGLPSSSTPTPTTANQMKPGGQTRCPLRLIYCCSKETLTAVHRQVSVAVCSPKGWT